MVKEVTGPTCGSADRIALETHRDAGAAMAFIREFNRGLRATWLSGPRGLFEPGVRRRAEALVQGIYAIAGRKTALPRS